MYQEFPDTYQKSVIPYCLPIQKVRYVDTLRLKKRLLKFYNFGAKQSLFQPDTVSVRIKPSRPTIASVETVDSALPRSPLKPASAVSCSLSPIDGVASYAEVRIT